MPVQHIQQLASWLAEAGIDYFELSGPGQRLRLRVQGGDVRDHMPPKGLTTPAGSALWMVLS